MMRQLQQRVVAEFMRFTKISELVFRDITAFEACCELIQQSRLSDQIEGDIGHRDIFLEDRAVAGPFGIALPKNERIVGEVQHVIEGGAHYICPTSSGIS